MFQILWVSFLVLGLASPALAERGEFLGYDQQIEIEDQTFIDCTVLEGGARTHCERLATARERAKQIPIRTFDHRVGKRHIPYREFVLVAYDPETDRWHDIVFGMPIRVERCPQHNVLLVPRSGSSTDYHVNRLRGCSLNKLVFEVQYQGKELLVYGAKHLLFTYEKLHPIWGGRTVELIKEVMYLSTPKHLVHRELAQAGRNLLMQAIDQVLIELSALRVPSRAYPGKLVTDQIPAETIANLILAEQTDPCFLADRPSFCRTLIPTVPYESEDEVRDAVKAEFAVNGLSAFRYLRSSANARGVLQFTDNRTEKYAGTYTVVLALYPEARLDPDFRRGTESLRNQIKAAALLLDLELANPKLPDWVRLTFLLDPELGLLFPGSAYNGGASQSHQLARLMERFLRHEGMHLDELMSQGLPWEQFEHFLSQPGHGLKAETLGYIKKIIKNWHYLSRHRPKVRSDFDGVLG